MDCWVGEMSVCSPVRVRVLSLYAAPDLNLSDVVGRLYGVRILQVLPASFVGRRCPTVANERTIKIPLLFVRPERTNPYGDF